MTVQTVKLGRQRFVIMSEKDYRSLRQRVDELGNQELGDIAEAKRRKASGPSRPYSELRKKLGLK